MSDSKKQHTFYEHFPTPEYLTLSNSGVAITDDSVHFMQLRRGMLGSTLKLAHYEKIPLPQGVVESGYINNAEKLTEVLADLSKRYRLAYIRATLPEERAYLFTVSIDKVPDEGLRDAVAFIIEENVPVTLENSVFDFDVLATAEEAGKITVAVSVISKKVVDFYLQVFEAAGMTPVSLDIESQAIARAAVRKGDRSAQMIVNLGDKKTGFYVIADGVVQFTTTLPYGAAASGTGDHLTDLQAEIKKIFAFWDAHHKTGAEGKGIEKILVCGQASLDSNLVALFMNDAPVPFEWVDPWKNAFSISEKLPADLRRDALEYTSATGLAIPHPHRTYV